MSKLKEQAIRSNYINFAFFAFFVFFADQIVKLAVRIYMQEGSSVSLINGFLDIAFVKNYGAGFGILQGHAQLLAWFSLIVVGLIMYFYDRIPETKNKGLGVGLAVGGTISNFSDRIFLGYVVDFIDFSFWPVFNIGDIGITLGAVFLIAAFLKS